MNGSIGQLHTFRKKAKIFFTYKYSGDLFVENTVNKGTNLWYQLSS